MFDPTLYPIIIIPVIDANGKRSSFAGFGKEPHLAIAPRFEDLPTLKPLAAEMLLVALAGGRLPMPATRRSRANTRNPSPQGRRYSSAPITKRSPVTAPPAEPVPNLTPKGRKERQKMLEQKLKARRSKR